MPKKSATGNPQVEWVAFGDNCAVLRRMVRSNGARGLLLQFTSKGRFAEVRQLALAAGFLEFGDTGDVYLMAPRHPTRFDAGRMAEILGGVVHRLPRRQLESYPWTIDYTAPDKGRSNSYRNISTTARPEFIGRNFRGEEVFRQESGVRSRKVRNADGRMELVGEAGSANPAEHLRAASRGDLPAIAAGMLAMAEHGSVNERDLARLAAAAGEGKPWFEALPDKADVELILRHELLKQIVEATLGEGDPRDSYHRAIKLADNAHAVIDTGDSAAKGLHPSAGLLIFLRRLTGPVSEIEFSGNSRLGLAVPQLRADGNPQHQLCDLTGADRPGLFERILNILAQRQADGTSMLLVAGAADASHVAAVRRAVGTGYAIETVAGISPLVGTGRHRGDPVTLFLIGQRRPVPSEDLPRAARRTFSVFERGDLDRLYVEILRSRRKIRDWHLGMTQAVERENLDREENQRQRPYVALSQVTKPFTMIPKSLEASTARALRRVVGDFGEPGGIDAAIAKSLGRSQADLGSILTAEQVDAVAMRHSASVRNRAFLLADQTGIGKGRSLAAMVRQRLRAGGKVLYLTENAEINIRDVWRDLEAVGALDEVRPVILVARHVQLMTVATSGIPPGKTARPASYSTVPASMRREIYASGQWPAGCNMVLTNYSQFNRGLDNPSGEWATAAPDENTLLVLDESHNAINPGANTGKMIRAMIEAVGPCNVVYATATPMRNPTGADLYKPLLPTAEGRRLDQILANLAPGGETAQESFTTMLGEDGVYLRRDHDLSNVEFEVRLPDDRRLADYQQIMNRFSPLVELMIDASLRVGALIGRAQGQRYLQMVADGMDEQTARSQCNALYQYTGAIGGPLVRLARVTINAIKVDQVVEETLSELYEGRKPLITFHSTSASLLNEIAAGGTDLPEGQLSLSDQIARVAESIFRIRFEDQYRDARDHDPAVRGISDRMNALIAQMPADLSVSPVDSVIEKLAARGFVAGEISGRTLAYRDQRIVRRQGTDRRLVVDAFNEGGVDVLIYNMAGATGGSYHAAPEFGDRRPRTLIEMETPVDIIKYIQSQGRGNRYGQVARPRIVSVMTGLIPEMRILQQRNRKLRALGASVDGNRSHPLLMDDIPDFLNKVGDRAAAQVLRTNPDLARRLGFREFLTGSEEEDSGRISQMMADSGASGSLIESIANRVLSRSLVLAAVEQTQLIELVRIEFEAIVEELESRNANPLRPKEIQGEIEIHATTLYSGVRHEEDDLEASAFVAPLYMSTGTHHLNDEPITGEQLLQMVNRSRIADGPDGFSPYAARVEAMRPTLLGHLLRTGSTISEALAAPEQQTANFQSRHHWLVRFIEFLKSVRPGVVLQIDGEEGERDGLLRTIVGLTAPGDEHAHLPQAYRIRTVAPGDQRPQIHSLKRLLALPPAAIRFLPGLETGINEHHLRGFTEQIAFGRRYPVQVLNGNLLAAIAEAERFKLGTMCLFRERYGEMQRGIVVNQTKVNLEFLPAVIPSGRVAAGLVAVLLADENRYGLTVWVGKRNHPDFSMRIHLARTADPQSRPSARLYAKKMFLKGVPESRREFDGKNVCWLRLPAEAEQLDRILNGLDGQDLQTDGQHRTRINELTRIAEEDGLPPLADMMHVAWDRSAA